MVGNVASINVKYKRDRDKYTGIVVSCLYNTESMFAVYNAIEQFSKT